MNNFSELFHQAHEAGMKAGAAVNPRPMVVSEANPDGSPRAGGQSWYVSEGACGFAWVVIRPGNSPLARAAKQLLGARKAYEGGVRVWVGEFGQSVARKEAYARAFARVLHEAGYDRVYPDSRLD